MNYQIIFSTYNNKTKTTGSLRGLEKFLATTAADHKIQGFSLGSQIGYWAGEYEKSYILTLFDIDKSTAFSIAELINTTYDQQSSIVKPIREEVYFIDNQNWGQ